MNCYSYIFGNFEGGYTQYPDDQTKDMFLYCAQLSTNRCQMIVHRDEKLMYYTYLQKLDEKKGTYVGISFNLSEIMLSDFSGIYSLLQNTLIKLAVQGKILDFDSSDIISKSNQFYMKEVEILSVFSELMENLDRLQDDIIALPPKAYGINQLSYNISDVNKDVDLLIKESNRFGYLILTKQGEQETIETEVKRIIDSVPLKKYNKNKFTLKDKLLIFFVLVSVIELVLIITLLNR